MCSRKLRLQGEPANLSLFGCHVNTLRPLASPGTKVRIKIVHRGCNFQALGKVVYARLDAIIRWDEKAGLHGMRYAPIIDVLEAQEKGDRL
jgi:hypothetical protein